MRSASVGPSTSSRTSAFCPSASLLEPLDPGALRVDRGGYLDRTDGLRFGDNPEDGIVRGREFLHPLLRFGIEFPEGWEVQNTATVVVARQPGQELYMLLQLIETPRGSDIREIADHNMRTAGYQVGSGDRTTINGLEAYLGSYQRQVDDIGQVLARVAHIRHDRNIFLFGGIGPADDLARIEDDVNRSIRSFRPLSREEAESILPNEIALYVARDGDTWQGIAQRAGEDLVQAATLAIMNES